MTTLFFTACGNSLSVAKAIGGELYSIPQLVREGRYEFKDDVIGIVSPTYSSDLPKTEQAFLNKARLEADYIFVICTYGYNAGTVTNKARKHLENAGNRVDYIDKVLMLDTALPRFEVSKELEILPGKKVEEHVVAICENIKARKKGFPQVPVFDHLAGAAYVAAGKSGMMNALAKKTVVEDQCVKCGTCVKVCPTNNVTLTDRVSFGSNCENCFACVMNCPKTAIHVRSERSAARYRNPDVKLAEIIKANS